MTDQLRRSVRAGRYRISYLQRGRGRTVVWLHGFMNSACTFRHVIRPLSLRHRVLVPDLVGCGWSSKPAAFSYTLAAQARILAKMLEALKIRRVALGGVSMGGAVALTLALEYPRLVERLILVDSAGLPTGGSGRRTVFGIPVGGKPARLFSSAKLLLRYYLDQFHSEHFVSSAEREHFIRSSLSRGTLKAAVKTLKANGGFHVAGLERLHAPTLIVWGERDPIFPPEQAVEFCRLIPDARYVMIPESGHLPQEEKPEDFVCVVSEFLRGAIPRAE